MTTFTTIQIIVQTNGQITLETKGFTGATCRDASRFIEGALGRIIDEQLTPEFHQEIHVPQQQTHRLP